MADLLEDILADLKRLRLAYERRNLLAMPDASQGGQGTAPSPLARDLLLADALLRNVVGAEAPGDARPLHVTVFGGTQVGKSTVINVLASRELATVHHTAGYTRHAQGFAPPGISPDTALAPFPKAFPNFDRVPRQTLSLDRPMEYSLEELPTPTAIDNTVLWDAPDCDAVDSSLFQQGFVEALTLAEAVVYVTSREKYAVNAILAWVARLRQSGVPLASVLNMTPLNQQAELLADMAQALKRVTESEMPSDTEFDPPPAIAFEYVQDGDVTLLYDPLYAPANKLRQTVVELASAARSGGHERQTQALGWIADALPAILEPATRDLEAWQKWNERLDKALQDFSDDYQKFYLDDPQRYDAFSRVGLEILELLNPPIPGLAKALVAVRTVVSLPARALLSGGQALYRFAASGGKSMKKPVIVPHEEATYKEAHNRLLNDLARFAERQRRTREAPGQAFWQALDQGWEASVPDIEKEFATALAAHRARSDEWVKETARGIYTELAKNPVKLNMLRTGRIAADAGAIVVSIKTGGPGDIAHDLVVAPALMSVVEAVSRQLAGNYVEQRKKELRERLISDTKNFAEDVYGKRLRALASESLGSIGLLEEDVEAVRTLGDRVRTLKREWEARA